VEVPFGLEPFFTTCTLERERRAVLGNAHPRYDCGSGLLGVWVNHTRRGAVSNGKRSTKPNIVALAPTQAELPSDRRGLRGPLYAIHDPPGTFRESSRSFRSLSRPRAIAKSRSRTLPCPSQRGPGYASRGWLGGGENAGKVVAGRVFCSWVAHSRISQKPGAGFANFHPYRRASRRLRRYLELRDGVSASGSTVRRKLVFSCAYEVALS